ncbi:hypothetical protein [Robiginitalea sp. SC105]|uniref:hypothetical protein n=1 Tax=Robiginitalea sp. SC105 TaxID=2762332 RepID=UPI00163A8400|nr:hypothetical protein [Robiginitalea sp. SC105]MBC2839342.1 hypothetical protein [Robiginitalea sp. SC105]
MVTRKTARKFRLTHRYLGIFLGIQFLMWTMSGLYFSWTDIDEIHGDHFLKEVPVETEFSGLLGTDKLDIDQPISSLRLLDIGGEPFYWVNGAHLVHARTGVKKQEVSQAEALRVSEREMKTGLRVAGIRRIDSVGPHHEYRGRPLPAYEISYVTPENLKAYVAVRNGAFQTVRHRGWRWFDFLWMTHTMDYQTRDDFNTGLLRAFSLLGLVTVLSGFALWFISSPTLRKCIRLLKFNK